ncbi:MAG: hypothetical protein IJP92_15255 [Lachnospiraceae bacterium]|nr:hypothetical protein [Lachnospiraceae bacterium]
MLYGDTFDIQIRNYYNPNDTWIGGFEYNLLIRVAASRGLTKNQLENYLTLQGMDIDSRMLEERLYHLVKNGYLSWVCFQSRGDNTQIHLYDLSSRGMESIKELGVPYVNPALEYFANGNTMRYMRIKILANQIALNLLYHERSLDSFFFHRVLREKGTLSDAPPVRTPLYVKTAEYGYLFDFAENTPAGKNAFLERMEMLCNGKASIPENTKVVIVAETYSHMESLTTLTLPFEKRGFSPDILYTHDDVWFYDLPGRFWTMARAMGQSGLMSVNLL